MPHFDTITAKEINMVKSFEADNVTGDGQTPGHFTIKTNFKLGAYAAPLVGTLNLDSSGSAHGQAAGVTAELIPPNGSLQRGALYALTCEIGCEASSTWGSAGPVGFIKFDQWGTKTHFDPNALFFDIQGLSEGSGNMFSSGADVACAHTLKCRIGATTVYLMLAAGESN